MCDPPPNACFAAGVCQAALDGGCTYAVMAGGGCNDGNNCTTGDTCADDGGCISGALTTCTAPACSVFTPGNCETDGGCRFTPAPAGTACPGGICNPGCVAATAFPFTPDNIVPAQHLPAGPFTVSCALTFSSGPDAGFSAPCPGEPLPTVSFADGGAAGELAVLSVSSLLITDAGSLTLRGTRPVVIAVWGSALVDGPLLANSSVAGTGPGSTTALSCGNRTGGAGRDNGGKGGGGGGAGFATFGAPGGGGNGVASSGGDGGIDDLGGDVPLLVGCPGGGGKKDTGFTPGGFGGGAIQLSVAGTLTISSVVSTSGQGGIGATGGGDPGGGGGGSGGVVTLQAQRLVVTGNGRVTANGGAGGGGAQGGTASPGADGSIASVAPAVGGTNENGGGPGGNGAAGMTGPMGGVTAGKGGGGGGGAMGRIFLKHVDTMTPCSVSGAAVLSPPPRRSNCP